MSHPAFQISRAAVVIVLALAACGNDDDPQYAASDAGDSGDSGGGSSIEGGGGTGATGGSGGTGGTAGEGGSGTGGSPPGGSGGVGGTSGAGGSTGDGLEGYWIWTQKVEDGQVIADSLDGPWSENGWMKLAFGPTGKAHFHFNVPTGSDYQTPGTYVVNGNIVNYVGQEHYSCAHPDQVDTEERNRYFQFKFEDGLLWASQTGFQGYDLPFASEPPQAPARWVTYRRLTQDEYYHQYMLRICQPTATAPECHPDCTSQSLVD